LPDDADAGRAGAVGGTAAGPLAVHVLRDVGALAATGSLPMSAPDFEAAIRDVGVAVDRDLAGFRARMEIVRGGPRVTAAPRASGNGAARSPARGRSAAPGPLTARIEAAPHGR
jgi:hypothetical protein